MENLPDMSVIMQLAKSPAGQELITLIQNSASEALDSAAAKASHGDFDGAKAALSPVLADKRIQELIAKLEGRE